MGSPVKDYYAEEVATAQPVNYYQQEVASVRPGQRPNVKSLIPGAVKQGVKSAIDPLLAPLGLDSRSREMQDMYGKGREAALEADPKIFNHPVSPFGPSAREGFSEEGPTISIPETPLNGKLDIKVSPRNIVKQIQGLGVDAAVGSVGDVAASRLPAAVGRGVLEPFAGGAEGIASRLLNYLIKPSKQSRKFGANPGRGVAKYVGPKMSKESLAEGIGEAKSGLLNKMEQNAADNPDALVDATPIFEQIRDTVKQLSKFPETYAGAIESHQAFARDLDNIVRQGGQIKDGRMYVKPMDAIKLKRQIGELPSWAANDPKLGSLNKTARQAYGAFDKEIDRSLPGNEGFNRDISDLIGAEKGLQDGVARNDNKSPVGLLEMIAGAAAGKGNVFSPEAVAAAAGVKALRSTPAITTMSSGLGQAAKAGRKVAGALEASDRPSLIESLLQKLLGKSQKASPAVEPKMLGHTKVEKPANIRDYAANALPEPQENASVPYDAALAEGHERFTIEEMKKRASTGSKPGMEEQRLPDQHAKALDELSQEPGSEVPKKAGRLSSERGAASLGGESPTDKSHVGKKVKINPDALKKGDAPEGTIESVSDKYVWVNGKLYNKSDVFITNPDPGARAVDPQFLLKSGEKPAPVIRPEKAQYYADNPNIQPTLDDQGVMINGKFMSFKDFKNKGIDRALAKIGILPIAGAASGVALAGGLAVDEGVRKYAKKKR